jgi:LacI family transcriptional regulator
MPKIPRRFSLITETASVLRQRIHEGEWSLRLPGEMELSTRLQVGRNTIRSALKLLEQEGLVVTRNGQRREIVALLPSSHVPRRAVLLMAKPENEYPPSTSAWIRETQSRLENQGWCFRLFIEPGLYRGNPSGQLRALVTGSPDTVWILHRSTPSMQRWFQEGDFPVVLAGSRHEGIELAQVEVDLRAVSRHAAGAFLARGHQRLAVLRPEGPFAGDAECVAGFRDAASRGEVVELRCKGGPGSVVTVLRQYLRDRHPATGLFILHPDHCLTALSFLLSEGVQVPGDLSVICRDDEPYLALIHPEPARYRHSTRTFGSKLAALVARATGEKPLTAPTSLVMPRAVGGGTLGPAPPVPKRNK